MELHFYHSRKADVYSMANNRNHKDRIEVLNANAGRTKTTSAAASEDNQENLSHESMKKARISLILLVSFSLIIMLTAVGMIYFYTRDINPDVVHTNDQTTVSDQTSENPGGFLNPDSPQQLENDASKIAFHPLKNSEEFLIGGGALMAVICGAYLFVKISENKEKD